MAQLKVIIKDPSGARKTPVELPDDVPLRRLIPALVTKMSLPTSQGGQPLTYEIDNMRTGKRLRADDTLTGAGVQEDDILTLLPAITAGGAIPSPRLHRLQSDNERLQKLVAQSELISIAGAEGTPPEKYLIVFTCRGIGSMGEDDEPALREYHEMEIELPAGYPTTRPSLKFRTPIFHPNIVSAGYVCIGPWYASKWLDQLVFMVAEMIQYKVPPTKDTPGDILNADAMRWIRRHHDRIPIDDRDVKSAGEELFARIKVGAEDLFSQIHILEH